MSTDVLSIILAIAGLAATWTLSVAIFSWWLSAQFRKLEKLVYRLIHEHKVSHDRQMRNLENKVLVLELKLFGHAISVGETEVLPPYAEDEVD